MLSQYLGRLVSLVLRLIDPRSSYSVTWETHDGGEEFTVGTFAQCNALIRHLLSGPNPALNVAGYRPDGVEDTFLFPAACVDYPDREPTTTM